MNRATSAFLLAGIPLGLIGLTMVAMLVDTPDNRELVDPVEIGLPASANRVFFHEDGWSDSSMWVAYSGSQMDMGAYVKAQCGKSISDFDDWKPGVAHSVPTPSGSSATDKVNWDIEKVTQGKTFSGFDGHSGIDILVDTVRWRIFLHRYTT